MNCPKVLIVGTVPYSQTSTSRAFDAYFHYWDKEKLVQIFSNPNEPSKGHCSELYQITDKKMLQRWISSRIDTGELYKYDNLTDGPTANREESRKCISIAYKLGARHTPLTHLLRGILWRKKFWCTEKLDSWIEKFRPECVFLAFSDDYFILQIALYVAQKYNIPIVSCIGDDYYFNTEFSFNPLYYLYKYSYRALVRKVLNYPGSAIYISDKIRDKYNGEFTLEGETVYLTSTLERKAFTPINTVKPLITYFGNIRMGRNLSLCEIAAVLQEISQSYQIEVYSNEEDDKFIKPLLNCAGIMYMGTVPYATVQQKMLQSDITIIVEGFREKDVNLSRYSLSTKAADALASGAAILTYGSPEAGIIEYMKLTGASLVCSSKTTLKDDLELFIYNEKKQEEYYYKQIEISNLHHSLQSSCSIVESIINKAINKIKSHEY